MGTGESASAMKQFGKAAVALVGNGLSFTVAVLAPENPWAILASGALAVLTSYGVYHTPYRPARSTAR